MENKLTAVQWLVEKYAIVMGLGSKELMKEHIERAKAMERQQIINAWDSGYYPYFHSKETGKDFTDGNEYYNETYTNENR